MRVFFGCVTGCSPAIFRLERKTAETGVISDKNSSANVLSGWIFDWQGTVGCRRLTRQVEESFNIVGAAHQIPLSGGFFGSPHQELSETHHLFDDSKDRFDCLLAQSITLSTPTAPESFRQRTATSSQLARSITRELKRPVV